MSENEAPNAERADEAPPPQKEGYASREIVLFLKQHDSSCGSCGLTLSGCKTSTCPGCGWVLDLEVLRSREPTVANIVRGWDAYCPLCGYNLKGSSGEGCPECGVPLTPRSLVLPDQRQLIRVRRPKTVAVLAGIAVCAFVWPVALIAMERPGLWELRGLACIAGPLAGALVAWAVLKSRDIRGR